ncbi:hypothetical protein Pmar_PMAR007561 [Perkinsus marinus ATCC 50983]|uniref:Uncharacterized protein n=1 Tax=Perkinsus marinus (strain ATCC 50983 / TXsc) TaxID=423536 RepID=C5LKC5_PERM5|nr:hypothetical protein Pmar_PMAR007561 [Perkinsus marinus ATCC 50983]EER02807.1 hypothetical protein Pmar_PMAR007561 [Perkinsus marinus ATCC 50983]|eukprot:XP_002770991.1 hypothetical protein Pmar_PMAR007561 [Perkinsus marinus ATCC 50983]
MDVLLEKLSSRRSTTYLHGLIQFVSPNDCHYGATQLLKSVVAREKNPPFGLGVLTQFQEGKEVLAFLPTFSKDGYDANLQFFVNSMQAGAPWERSSQWLNMTTQGGLVVQLNSESTNSLTALKRVDLPLNNVSAESVGGAGNNVAGASTIVDFGGFPSPSAMPGNVAAVSTFATLRCQYESAVSSLLDCSFSYTTDSEPLSRVAQFSRSACSDMIGNNVWSHMEHSEDLSMGYPEISEASSGYYDDYCLKEFEDGRLVWSMSMLPLECRNTDLKGQGQAAYMVLRGVPNVAWYLYGTYPSAGDCNSNTDWDGSIFQQVQQDCNSREGSWVCVAPGACTIEVKPTPRTDFTWVAYVVVIIVVAIIAASLLIRAVCSRDGLTSAGAVLDAKSSGGVVTLSGGSSTDSVSQARLRRETQRQSNPDMHFDMPAEKVAKVVAAAKARVHGNDSCRSFDANESPLSEGSGFMSTPVSRHNSSVLGEESSETLKQRYVRQKFTNPRSVPRGALDPSRRVVVRRR